MVKERNYGIDLFRLIAMLEIVILHILGHGGQMLRRAKHTGGFFGKRQNESSDGYGYERHEKHGLGDGRTCQNGFSFRQVNGSDYGTTCPHHQSNTHE